MANYVHTLPEVRLSTNDAKIASALAAASETKKPVTLPKAPWE